jgi:hypothetical protein
VRALGKDRPKVKAIIKDEQREVNKWNNYAEKLNSANRKSGGTKDILHLKKNRYL